MSRIRQLRKWVDEGKVTVRLQDERYELIAFDQPGRTKSFFGGWSWSWAWPGQWFGGEVLRGHGLDPGTDYDDNTCWEMCRVDPSCLNPERIRILDELCKREGTKQ